ncbi:MAG: SDR family oxidoreductase [Actinobacteria bacterium]|nr:SDR family oxidoreductase [Actinomycetota bacterium]
MRRFEGYSVIVTGGGNGMGRDIARRFVEEGASVLVADIDGAAAAAQAAELGAAAAAAAVDVSDPAQCSTMVQAALDHAGRLDVLVNNVGVHHLFENAMDLPDSEFDRMLDVNTKPLLYTAKAAVPHLRASGRGSIVTVASIGAVVIRPGASLYAASKSASIAMTKSLALELAPEVRVNCVLPTSTDTGLLRNIPGADPEWVRARYARNAENLPMKRLGTGDDVAAAIAFLASDDASFITGVALPVDGGRSAGGA